MALYDEFANRIKPAEKILIISHKKPDGDTLGAGCALKIAFENLGKKHIDLACIDPVSPRFKFIPEVNKYKREITNYQQYDLIIIVDCGAHYMTKFHEKQPEILSGQVPIINIDHHASNDLFGQLNIVEEETPSTTIMLYKMFTYLKINITPQMATCLMAGIYNDTGSFMHSNTTQEVYNIAADLVSLGAKVTVIAKHIFNTNPVSTLKMWGKAMDNAFMTNEGFTMSVVTEQDIKECNATAEDLSGVVDILNSVPDSKFTVIINEDCKGNIKGSFRTNQEDVDLLDYATIFNGGGHRKAAGFTLKGKLQKKEIWTLNNQENQNIELNKMISLSQSTQRN